MSDVPAPTRHRRFSLRRVLTIAGGTFTQLVRMKVFSFMAIFAVALIGASFAFADLKTEQELKMLKDVAFPAMSLFAMLFAIAGTALLIPRDVEDRTLYTILCKPVARIEYLLGKLCGVVWLIFISLICMDILFCGVLHLKDTKVRTEQLENLEYRRLDPEEKEIARAEIIRTSERLGVTWNLQAGIVATFLKSVVMSVVALLLSTAATSTMFTIMASIAVMIIGHMQSLAREFFLSEISGGAVPRLISGLVALIFPDFASYDVIEAVMEGTEISLATLAKMTGLTGVYLTLYMLAAWVLFSDKEL
jgi:hypothetical protein